MADKAQVWRYYRYDNYAVLQTLENVNLNVGDKVNVTSVGASFNGNNKVIVACPLYEFIGVDSDTGEWMFNTNNPIPNQVMYQSTGADTEITALTTYGLVTWDPQVTWITAGDIEDYIGIPEGG